MSKTQSSSSLRIWLPALRTGSGTDTFTESLAKGLRDAGHEPILQWFDHRFELAPWKLRGAPAPPSVDIIHSGSWQGFAFKRDRIPLVVTEHHDVMDPDYRRYKSFRQRLYHSLLVDRWMNWSFAAADEVTAVSQFTGEILRTVRGLRPIIIPNWVDLNEFSPAVPSLRGGTRAPFRLLFVGNTTRRKGADVVPRLAAMLGSQFEIECTAGLRQMPGARSSANITVLGRMSRSDLVDAYRRCDAALVPSRYEGFGYAAAEAMACGKPVVGYHCGAIAEVVGKQGSMLLSEIDDIEGLAAICRSLYRRPERAIEYGLNARQRMATCFQEAAAISAYVGVYHSVIRK